MHPFVHCTPIKNWIFKLLRIFHMYIQYSTYSTVIYLAERLWFAWSLFIYCSCNPFLWSYIYVYPFKYNLLHISDAFLAMQLIKTLFFFIFRPCFGISVSSISLLQAFQNIDKLYEETGVYIPYIFIGRYMRM